MQWPGSIEWRKRKRLLVPTLLFVVTATSVLLVLAGAGLRTARSAPPALRFFDPRRPPTIDEGWTACVMDYTLSSTEKNDAIFVGDSICRSGLDPGQFEKLTQLRAYNLGVLFGGLGPDVLLNVAKTYLVNHPAPRIVVLCTSPVCFERELPSFFVPVRDRFLNCFAFEAPNLQSNQGRLSYLMSISYLIRQGTLMNWDRTTSSLAGREHDVRDDPLFREEDRTYRTLERQVRQARGFYPMSGSGRIGFLDRSARRVPVEDDWDRSVRRLAETCEEAHVPLLIRLGPISAEASKDLVFDRVESWVKQLQVSYPHVTVARDHNVLRYPTALCADSTHPNVQGAAKFTADVADDARRVLGLSGPAKSN
jgi:hypothetical protein